MPGKLVTLSGSSGGRSGTAATSSGKSSVVTVRSSSQAVKKLISWWAALYDDFGDAVPPPEKVPSIVSAAEGALTTTLRKFVGSCTNGAAFLTATNTIAKFTIDEQESVLWGQLWGKQHPNIAQCYGSWQLASKESGETIVYLVHVEFVPHPITGRIAELMRLVGDNAWKAINAGPAKVAADKTTHNNRMTMAHVRALRAAAQEDQRLAQLIDLLVDLTDMGVYIYDLQPDNFRLGDDNQIKLIDPSTPIGARGRPQKLVFESRRFRGIGVGHIIF